MTELSQQLQVLVVRRVDYEGPGTAVYQMADLKAWLDERNLLRSSESRQDMIFDSTNMHGAGERRAVLTMVVL